MNDWMEEREKQKKRLYRFFFLIQVIFRYFFFFLCIACFFFCFQSCHCHKVNMKKQEIQTVTTKWNRSETKLSSFSGKFFSFASFFSILMPLFAPFNCDFMWAWYLVTVWVLNGSRGTVYFTLLSKSMVFKANKRRSNRWTWYFCIEPRTFAISFGQLKSFVFFALCLYFLYFSCARREMKRWRSILILFVLLVLFLCVLL